MLAIRVTGLLLSFCLGGLASWQEAPPGGHRRRALIIGNGAYRNMPEIATALNDAREVSEALRRLNFEVDQQDNADLPRLAAAAGAFAEKLGSGDIAFVYYSGYAVQSNGENYLIPVEFPASNSDLYTQAYSVSLLESQVASRGAGLRIMVLEACRDNPVLGRTYPDPGLAAPKSAAKGALLAFSAPAGRSLPAEPERTLDAFTQYLVASLKTPGLTVDQVFKRTQTAVTEATHDAQIPLVTSLIVADLYITGSPPPAAPAAPKVELGIPRRNQKDKEEYVWIPAGEFQMGCIPSDPDCADDERPRHPVRISKGFWIGRTEVEVVAYKTYAKLNRLKMPPAPVDNRNWRNENHPMSRITWEQAGEYCAWAGGRLPTEAEWEQAARAGLDGKRFPWGDEITRENANYFGTGSNDLWEGTAPVRRFEPNAWGLYDVAGNVWEWVADWYDPAYYSHSPAEDPKGPGTGRKHVRRGGSWDSGPKELRTSIRSQSETFGNNTGFRCLLENLKP